MGENERFLSDAHKRPRTGAEAARPVRRWCIGEQRGSTLSSPSCLEGPPANIKKDSLYYIILCFFSPRLPQARPGMELQRAVWERESPPKMAPRPRAPALEGDSGLKKTTFWGRLGGFNPRMDPACQELFCRAAGRWQPVSPGRPCLEFSTGLSISRFLCQSCAVLGWESGWELF